MIRKARRDFSELSAPAAIGLALLLSVMVSGALALFSILDPVNNTTIALFYLLPVGVSASLWGLQAGIASAVASFLGFNFLFISPTYSFYVKDLQDLVVLLAVLAGITYWLTIRGRWESAQVAFALLGVFLMLTIVMFVGLVLAQTRNVTLEHAVETVTQPASIGEALAQACSSTGWCTQRDEKGIKSNRLLFGQRTIFFLDTFLICSHMLLL